MPPLIKTRLVLNGDLEIYGIYDSGSNVSLINSRLLKIKNNNNGISGNTNLRTINGVKKATGRINLNIKIFNIEKKISVFVIDEENFNYDFLIGLDCIKNFYLTQNENLEIKQNLPQKKNQEDKNTDNKITKVTEEGKIQNTKKSEKVRATSQNLKKEEINLNKKRSETEKTSKNFLSLENQNVADFNEHIDEENFEMQINHLDYKI